MKILWLIPLNTSINPLVISQKDFMASEKNEIARSIREIGHEIKTVIGFTGQPADMNGFSDANYFRMKRPQWLFKCLYHLKMLKTLFADDFDVVLFGVHSSHLIPFSKAISFFRRHKPLLILDIRTIPVDLAKDLRSKLKLFRYNASVKTADKYCDGITCITPMLGATLKRRLIKLKNKIGYFQTGVNFEIFDPSKSTSLRKLLCLEDNFVILYHGVLSQNRGLQNVIKALDLCTQHIPNIVFLVVGAGDGEGELRNITKEFKLEKNVLFTGGVPFDKIPDYIRTADVGVIPLPNIEWWNVSSPIKLKEYLAMQLPVIATDIPAHRFVIEKAGGATLVKGHRPDKIANAILNFFKTRQTTYPLKTRSELFKMISYDSQAREFIDYVNCVSSLSQKC